MNPSICNGCGNESPDWGKLCNACEQEVICHGCDTIYKRGQGLQDVNMCPRCLHESMETQEQEQFNLYGDCVSPYEEYGFDYPWEK